MHISQQETCQSLNSTTWRRRRQKKTTKKRQRGRIRRDASPDIREASCCSHTVRLSSLSRQNPLRSENQTWHPALGATLYSAPHRKEERCSNSSRHVSAGKTIVAIRILNLDWNIPTDKLKCRFIGHRGCWGAGRTGMDLFINGRWKFLITNGGRPFGRPNRWAQRDD